MKEYRLRNYIPISGPATRQPCDGSEAPFRVSLGFSPLWYHDRLGVDFSRRWHTDPQYRYDTLMEMKALLHEKFPSVPNFCPHLENGVDYSCATLDGAYGAMIISAIYGLEVHYFKDNWPSTNTADHLTKEQLIWTATRPFRN